MENLILEYQFKNQKIFGKERPTFTTGGLARVYRGVLDYRGDGIPFQSGSGEPENDLHWSLEGPN